MEESEDIDPVIPAMNFGNTETSSPSRRNKDLADIIFGSGVDYGETSAGAELQQSDSTKAEASPEKTEEAKAIGGTGALQASSSTASQATQVPPSYPAGLSRNGSILATKPDTSDLLKEVQARTEAAMAQLHRPMNGTTRTPPNPAQRKRINPQDISSPTLLQSSASVEKIPTFPATSPYPSSPGPQRSGSKLSFGIRRLRNTLKGKPSPPNGEEVTPWSNELPSHQQPPQTQTPQMNTYKSPLLSPKNNGSFNGFRSTTSISPPASAGPSLKTFMSRFRKKSPSDGSTEADNRYGHSSVNSSPDEMNSQMPSMPSSAPANGVETFPKTSKPSAHPIPLFSQTVKEGNASLGQLPFSAPTSPSDPAALKRFFEAAQDIGLGKVALDYLSSVNPEWNPSTPTVIVTNSNSAKNSLEETVPRENSVGLGDRMAYPSFESERSMDLTRSRSLRDYQSSPTSILPRRVRELADAEGSSSGAIVRRTIIFPSGNGSTTDLAALVRKASKKSHRASAISTQSNRSVHDRVPTPPPSKAKRHSVDTGPEPPVPFLPSSSSWASHGASHSISESNIERSGLPHDSL